MDEIIVATLSKYFTKPLFGYDLATFEYRSDVTLLTTPLEVFGGIATYLTVVFGLRHIFASRKPLSGFLIKGLLFLHNVFLAIASLVLLLGLASALFIKIRLHGLATLFCACDLPPNPRLDTFYYLNYLLKYYELIDTVFLAVRKRPLTFLHVYHHSATMFLCWTQLQGKSVVQWVPISLNLFVHVVMYYYYALAALNIHPWWKKYLTSLQILQFVLDLVACYVVAVISSDLQYHIFEGVFAVSNCCDGTPVSMAIGCVVLTSYLLLFIRFYIQTYHTKPGSKIHSD